MGLFHGAPREDWIDGFPVVDGSHGPEARDTALLKRDKQRNRAVWLMGACQLLCTTGIAYLIQWAVQHTELQCPFWLAFVLALLLWPVPRRLTSIVRNYFLPFGILVILPHGQIGLVGPGNPGIEKQARDALTRYGSWRYGVRYGYVARSVSEQYWCHYPRISAIPSDQVVLIKDYLKNGGNPNASIGEVLGYE